MWWLLGFIILLSPFAYLLFAPFFIEIDSAMDLYRFRFHRLASVCLLIDDSLYVDVKFLWWSKKYDLLKRQYAKTEKKVKIKKHPEKKTGHRNIRMNRIWKVIQSFRFNRCFITFDTSDMPLNGILYPWFYMLSWKTGKTIMVNFCGENKVQLEIENSIARMLWAYIKV